MGPSTWKRARNDPACLARAASAATDGQSGVKPVRFKHVAAATVSEAVSLLGEFGDGAKILAGGQSLIPLMNLRLARPDVLVEIGRIVTLDGISASNDSLTIGAMTTQRDVALSPDVRTSLPLVADAMRHIGHPAIRSRGTFGGSAAHADPAAEIPCLLTALDAKLTVTGPLGTRTIDAEEFFQGYFSTALADDEVLEEVTIPTKPADTGQAFVELARRDGDFALAGVAAVVQLDAERSVRSSSVALCGVADRPVRARAVEELIHGRSLDDNLLVEAGRLASSTLEPLSDQHASGAYRQEVATVLVERALRQAVDGADGSENAD